MNRLEKNSNSRIYQVSVVGLFLTLMGVVMGVASPGMSDTDLGVVSDQVHLPVLLATAFFYGLILLRLVPNGGKILSSRALFAFAPLVLFCIVSTAWSTNPGITLRRSAFLLLSTVIGLILGSDYNVPELVRLWAVASLIHIVLCCVFYIFMPSVLYSPSDMHALKGLTTHKNIFGFEQGLALLCFLLVPFHHLKFLRIPLAVTAGLFLVLSHSSGSLVATICALGVLPVLLLLSHRGMHRIPVTLLSVAFVTGLGWLLSQNTSFVPTLLSKDATLTGRTQLWSLVVVAIGHHPFAGYGYDAFWQGLQGDSLEIIRGVGWLVPTAHNGYLDLLLGVGSCGAILFLVPLFFFVSKGFSYLTREKSSARYFPLVFILFILIYNLNESALLTRSGLPFLFFAALTTSLSVRVPRALHNSAAARIHDSAGRPSPLAAGAQF